jgi:hypothetical protein
MFLYSKKNLQINKNHIYEEEMPNYFSISRFNIQNISNRDMTNQRSRLMGGNILKITRDNDVNGVERRWAAGREAGCR